MTDLPGGPAPPLIMADLSHPDSLGVLGRQTTVLELVASGASLSAVLTAVTTALEELIPGCRCSILLLDTASNTLHHGAAPTLPPEYSAAIDGMRIGTHAGSCGAAAYLGTEIVAEDIACDPRWARFRDLAMPHGLRSCWSSPIRSRTVVLGTFAVYYDDPHLPTGREERLVERFTHLASLAIEHARLYGALAESEERFRRAFEDNAVGMALTDLDGRFGKVNRALQDLLGRSEEELLARDLSSLLSLPDHGPVAAALDQVRTGAPGPVQFETDLQRCEGVPVRASVTASLVRGANGGPDYLSVNMLDVTARRAAEHDRRVRRESEVARVAAEAASRAKSQFLSALSHELRTPLQAITGFTELLGTLDLPFERRRAALGHIAGATSHILDLVNDVLDIAGIEAGALPLHVVDVDLGALVGEIVELLQPVAAERGIVLAAEPIGATVRADTRRLRQILLNLVTNGVHYNDSGGWVRVAATENDGRAGDDVTVEVADSGPGIPDELIGRLFVPFDRLGAEGGGEPGSGLGMVIARGLAEAMGGQLCVRSAPGQGTTVTVRLPAARGLARGDGGGS